MKQIILLIALLCFVGELSSQQRVLKGVVKDLYSNKVIPFVNIIVFNTNKGTSANEFGEFLLEVDNNEFVQLKLSSLGYKVRITEELHLSSIRENDITIYMEPDSKKISEIEVRPSLFVTKKEAPVSMRRIGIDQIEKSAGANRDISKVIQSFPGVTSTPAYRNDIIVRGGGPSENSFYIDGVEIPTINHFSTQGASGGPVGILNVDFIREVDFYSSAFPVEYGNALSSVLEIKQLDGNKERTNFKGVLGASELSMSVSSPMGKKTTMLASVRRSYLQFLFKVLDLPFLPTFTDFQFKTKTNFNTKNELTFLGFGAIDDFELNKEVSDSPENQYILSYVPVQKQKNYTIGANYKHYFEDSYLTLVLSRSYLDNSSVKYFGNVNAPENLILNYQSYEVQNKLRLEYKKKSDVFSFSSGMLFEDIGYENETYRKSFLMDGVAGYTYSTSLNVIKYGAFVSGVFTFANSRGNILAGIRSEGNSYSNEMNNPLQQISPRFSLSYKMSSMLELTGSVSRYYQLPPYTTMGYKNENQVLINKNNELKYITSDHYVLGVNCFLREQTKIEVEGFYKKYTDYPFSVNDSVSLAGKGADYGTFGDEEVLSKGKGRAYGFEVLLREKSMKGFNYIISYSFVKSEIEDKNGKYIPGSWDSRHLITATLNKKINDSWDFGLKWRFVGGLPYTPVDENVTTLKSYWDVNGKEYPDYNRYNQNRLNAFHQLDLRIDKSFQLKKSALSFYLDIQNLYNKKIDNPEKYVLVYDENSEPIILNPEAPEEEQRYLFDKISTKSGTLLPTIGIVVEF